MDRFCIVVTGLPCSGKSTIASLLSPLLGAVLLDKDDFLEQLFEEKGVGNLDWRRQLSRESDVSFLQQASVQERVVLVSHWRPLNLSSESGTPLADLQADFPIMLEICCDCPVALAAERFLERRRHPGHCDSERGVDELTQQLSRYQSHLPLLNANYLKVSTTETPDIESMVAEIHRLLSR